MPKKLPRLFCCLLSACLALLAVFALSPQQFPVIFYKFALVLAAGLAGYWLDRWVFPYSRPDGYLKREWGDHPEYWPDDHADFEITPGYHLVFAAALLRRALVVAAAMLAAGLGL